MKAFTEISMAERLINSGECNEAADRLLQAKVIMLSMLTSEELSFLCECFETTEKEVIMYKVIDTYDGYYDVIGSFETLDAAKDAARERFDDTDGECQISIYRKMNRGYEVIV